MEYLKKAGQRILESDRKQSLEAVMVVAEGSCHQVSVVVTIGSLLQAHPR